MPKFYLTTPLYYVNDVPHIGHAYTTIMADVIKRLKRQRGYDVFFLTGTDEHGLKIEKSAHKQGLTPKELADNVVMRFKHLWQRLYIDYDKFIRTTDQDHIQGVTKIWQKAMDNGDLYEGEYKGHYCVSCESFVAVMEENDEEDRICPDCGKKTEQVSETCFFFRLSAYQDRLLEFYEKHPHFVLPKVRMNEVISFVKMGLKDLSVTRSTVKWGIPVPGRSDQTIYVWFDALSNYINGVHYHLEDDLFRRYWPADLHLLGKDILKFHAIYWPAFLMSAGVDLPRQELIHGWWLKDEKKMSKSTGNVLDPEILLKFFDADAIRYFMMREASIGADGNFSHQGFITRINTDLANDWGNLVSRTAAMIEKYFQNELSSRAEYGEEEKSLQNRYTKLEQKVLQYYESYQFNRGLELVFEYISELNRYIVKSQPWELAKSPETKSRLACILKTLIRAITSVNSLLAPVTPVASAKINRHFKAGAVELGWQNLSEDITVEPLKDQLFPRIDLEEFLAAEVRKEEPMTESGLIEFNEFKKVKMIVAKVLEAVKVTGTDKLLQLKIDTGSDERILVAGVAQYYPAEDLVGKKIIVVKNLQPAKIRGILSEGMILAASGADGRPHIPILPDETPVGAPLV